MAGLDPAIHATAVARISIMRAPSHAGRMGLHRDEPAPRSSTGVTSDLARRAWEHWEGVAEGFTKRYGLKLLVYAERHDDIRIAIQRERNLKHWSRAWKIQLILAGNPDWNDLYDQLV